jgi:Bacterial regulatory helix-turn-helix protein, lysR family
MELRHLRYFLAVGDALNFTKAAAQLRVAQPALSRKVQDLEDEIGVDLMKLRPRGVTLTAERARPGTSIDKEMVAKLASAHERLVAKLSNRSGNGE